MQNVTCYESGCTTVGSLGNNAVDFVDNVIFEDIRCIHSSNAAWIKTYPGQGHVKNVEYPLSPFTPFLHRVHVSLKPLYLITYFT